MRLVAREQAGGNSQRSPLVGRDQGGWAATKPGTLRCGCSVLAQRIGRHRFGREGSGGGTAS
jgi:hypothetical protein